MSNIETTYPYKDRFVDFNINDGSMEHKILMNVVERLLNNNNNNKSTIGEQIIDAFQKELDAAIEVYGKYMHDREFRDAYKDYIFEELENAEWYHKAFDRIAKNEMWPFGID